MHLPRNCPACGEQLDAHDSTSDPDARPEAGDVAVCAHCGQVGIFTETSIRLPTEDEAAELAENQQVQEALGSLLVAGLTGGDVYDALAIARNTGARKN